MLLQLRGHNRDDPLIQLIVCEGVERVDEDGANPRIAAGAGLQEMVEDGVEETLRLSRTRPGGHNGGLRRLAAKSLKGSILMPVGAVRVLSVLEWRAIGIRCLERKPHRIEGAFEDFTRFVEQISESMLEQGRGRRKSAFQKPANADFHFTTENGGEHG